MMKRLFYAPVLLIGLTINVIAQEPILNKPSDHNISSVDRSTERVSLEQRVQRFKQVLNQLKDCALRKKKCTNKEIVGIVAILITLYLAIVGIIAVGLKTGVIQDRDQNNR